MSSSAQITTPRYLKIAVDLATRIASGEITEGERLKGRSILSTEYHVSPETIRRAMSILSDKQVVEVYLGSGIVVSSRAKAIQFVNSFKDDESIAHLHNDLDRLFAERRQMDKEISTLTSKIIDLYKYKRSDLVSPVEVSLPEHSAVIGKSIGQLEIWHNTGATIIGVVQHAQLLISPGPYYEFQKGDKVLIVGDENVIGRFNTFVRDV
ncbi:MAG TPA: GntR family transcriptional regulator [Ruminococcaceae bacterium]|nr:GntR family transcriptional regulator [Oscillospiraceae bacterium]